MKPIMNLLSTGIVINFIIASPFYFIIVRIFVSLNADNFDRIDMHFQTVPDILYLTRGLLPLANTY